jgi:bifunctional non-homologous end joining protein LigD
MQDEQRVLIPAEDGMSHKDIRRYYRRVGDRMLPELYDRPLVPRQFPEGIGGEPRILWGLPADFPAWIARTRLPDTEGQERDYILCNDEQTLLYLVDRGCVEFHVWASRSDRPGYPDRMIFDLDPDSRQRLVRAGARALRDVLDQLRWPSFVRTTGQKGLHVLVPLDRTADHDEVRAVATEIARVVCARDPGAFTLEDNPAARGNRLYIGCDRNRYGRTAIATYSVRARPGAPVAAPIEWTELARRAPRADQYHVRNVFRRLGQKATTWNTFRDRAISLGGARDALSRLSSAALRDVSDVAGGERPNGR